MFVYQLIYKWVLNFVQFILYIEKLAPIKLFNVKLFKGKMAQIIEQKNLHPTFYRNSLPTNPIWIHAASGELEYAKPLFREIKKQNPKQSILVTYFSPSALSMIEKTKEIDAWSPLPWDTDSEILNFLNKFKPQVLIIARTDLWPNLIRHCKNRNIKTILMGATFAEGSKKIKGLGKWVTKLALTNLDHILVVSQTDQQMLESIYSDQFAKKTIVSGDPRLDQVYHRIQEKRPLPQLLTDWARNNLVLVAGSTWPEDEQPLIKALAHLNLKALIVPHENTYKHIDSLKKLCVANGLSVSVWSEYKMNSDEQNITSQILIFDQMGLLADLYQLAPLAFVGGSFKAQVHSVMEALAYGCKVFVGPHYKNNREAIEFSKLQFVIPCKDCEDLINKLASTLASQNAQEKTLIQDRVLSQRGATQTVLNLINPS